MNHFLFSLYHYTTRGGMFKHTTLGKENKKKGEEREAEIKGVKIFDFCILTFEYSIITSWT